MSILIGADLVPTKSNRELFAGGEVEALLGKELAETLKNASFRIFNLETPLADKETPIDKCGPALIAPTSAIRAYEAMMVDLLTLANNHILDQGIQGLQSTCEVLDSAKISYLGVGANQEDASRPFVFQFSDKKVGVYACAEHEFSIVEEGNPGANPFDALETPDHVANLKKQCDFVVVLYHGGKEHYRYPSPDLQKVCRKLVDKGADLVVCQHSHCIGCEEKYNGGTIVYGQGNFLFDHSDSEFWQTSLLIKIEEDFTVSYIPLRKNGNGTMVAAGNDADDIMREFRSRSEEIKLPGVIEENYTKFAKTMVHGYLLAMSGTKRSLFIRVINKLLRGKLFNCIVKKKYNKDQKMILRNFIECEAHRELFLRGLK